MSGRFVKIAIKVSLSTDTSIGGQGQYFPGVLGSIGEPARAQA
jgi:hypothetical protein